MHLFFTLKFKKYMDKETKFIDNLMESITKRRLNETKPQEMPMTGRFGRGRFGDRGRFCVSLKQGDTEPSPVSLRTVPCLQTVPFRTGLSLAFPAVLFHSGVFLL